MAPKCVEEQEAHAQDSQYIATLLQQITEQQEAYAILYNRNLLLHKEWTDAMLCIQSAKHLSPSARVIYAAAQPPPTASALCTP
jgi:hypothetical protein